MKKYTTLSEIRLLHSMLNPAEIVRLVLDLQNRHIKSQFVHGDLKPENIVYDNQMNQLRLIDYINCRLVNMSETTVF